MTVPKANSEFCFPENIEGRGETKLTVSRGESHKVFCYSSRLKDKKNLRKNDLLDAYGGCTCSTRGSQAELSYQNDTITVFFSAAKEIKTILKLLYLLLMLNSRILGLI